MKSELILFTSMKGGSGKSTVCANVAAALASLGKKVLVLSLDRYSASCDMIFGMESSYVYDVWDYPEHSLGDICLRVSGNERVSLSLSLPLSEPKGILPEAFLQAVSESEEYDFILVDKAAGEDMSAVLWLSKMADRICVITTQMSDSVRSAELLSNLLYEEGIPEEKLFLIINSFYVDVRAMSFCCINDIMTCVKRPIIGIVPFSDPLYENQKVYTAVGDPSVASSFLNVAKRLLGEEVKLLDFLPVRVRRRLLNQ